MLNRDINIFFKIMKIFLLVYRQMKHQLDRIFTTYTFKAIKICNRCVYFIDV
jgi:hypothetical protein